MKVHKKELNTNVIQSIGEVTAMKFDADSESEIFDILTDGLYSDPIGSIVREVTSNCFDSHIEAGNNTTSNPVIVKLTEEVGGHYISFIDNGVGMSPDRIYNVFGTYLKSTKDTSNDQIGGFGLGGKTPLTYNTRTFFVVTRKDKIQYSYNVFEGNNSPMIELLSQESTKEGNGTVIKVPVKESDLTEFEQKTLRQLYYFENIVFEGFSDYYVTNDYNIVKGDNFLYRGTTYSDYMHVCFGKVAYPIDFETLGLDKNDYMIPVAIKIEIGELDGTGVTRSREQLKYTVNNRKIITAKMNKTVDELLGMIGKQMDNVRTVKEYYKVMREFKYLQLTDTDRIDLGFKLKKDDVVLNNFKFGELVMPEYIELIDIFYDYKRYGKKDGYHDSTYQKNFKHVEEFSNVVHVKGDFKRVVLKQSYLQSINKNFHLHTPVDLNDPIELDKLMIKLGLTENETYKPKNFKPLTNDGGFLVDDGTRTRTKYLVGKKKATKLALDVAQEIYDWMDELAIDYDELVVPDDYIQQRKKKIDPELLKNGIPLKVMHSWRGNRDRIKFQDLINYTGRIYYGFRDDESSLSDAYAIQNNISGSDSVCGYYSRISAIQKGTMFISISKQNEKYFKMLGKKAINIKFFFHTYVSRKVDKIIKDRAVSSIRTKYDNDVLYQFKKSYFKDIDEEIYDKVITVQSEFKDDDDDGDEHYSVARSYEFERTFGKTLSEMEKEVKTPCSESLDWLIKVSKKSRKNLDYISMVSSHDFEENDHDHFIALVNLCIDK